MKNDSLKVILIVILVLIAGYFLYQNFAKTDAGQQGAVISGTPTNTASAQMHIEHCSGYGGYDCVYINDPDNGIQVFGNFVLGICVPALMTGLVGGSISSTGDIATVHNANIASNNGVLTIVGDNTWATQLKLYMLGYLKTAPTGILDTNTTTALRAYQQAKGLQVTGTITPEVFTSTSVGVARIPSGTISVTRTK